MTLSLLVTDVTYNGDASNQVFDIANGGNGIYYEATAEVVVALIAADGTVTLQVEGVDYSVSAANTAAGFITFLSYTPIVGEQIYIKRDTALDQDLNLTLAGAFNPTNVMGAFDKVTRALQDQKRRGSELSDLSKVTINEDASPPTSASAGQVVLYAATDGSVHALDDQGNDTNLTTGPDTVVAAQLAAEAAQTAAESASSTATTQAGTATTQAGIATTAAGTATTQAATATTKASEAAASAIAAAAASESLAWTYAFDSATADADPGSGQFRFNNVAFSSATELYISENADEGDISALMTVWDDSSSTIKAVVRLRNPSNPTKWAEFYVTGSIVDNGTYRTIPISPIAINDNNTISTTFPDGTVLMLGVQRNGDAGSGAVDSFNGRSGSILPAASDYDAGQIDNDSAVGGAFVDDALNTLNNSKLANVVEDLTPQLGGPLDANGKQIQEAIGTDIASSATITVPTDGNMFNITGTTAISAINTVKVGALVTFVFGAALTLTHHATDLILPSGANIDTAAGDVATFREYATGDWRCESYVKADGKALVETDSGGGGGGSGGPSVGTNAVIRTNAKNIIEDITLADHTATCTADSGADTLSVGTDDDFADEDTVYLTTTGTLPAGLAIDTEYYVRDAAAGTLKLAATNGGTAIDITDVGTGTHTIYQAINGHSAGPITVETGHSVTVPAGSTWTVS